MTKSNSPDYAEGAKDQEVVIDYTQMSQEDLKDMLEKQVPLEKLKQIATQLGISQQAQEQLDRLLVALYKSVIRKAMGLI